MSRTIRRKGYSRDREWLLEKVSYTHAPTFSYVYERISPKSPEGRELIAKYHSDAGKFMGNAPHWYCNIYERAARRAAKHQLHRYMKDPENIHANTGWQVLMDPNHHRNATWSWW